MASICSANRTGAPICSASPARTASGSAGYGVAVLLAHTGTDGGRTVSVSSVRANASPAPAISGLWNAQATWSRFAVSPASRSRSIAVSTAVVGPEITVCRGELRLAVTTSSASPASASTFSTSSADAVTAAMVPASPPRTPDRMASARAALAVSRSSGVRAPATASATSSP